MKPIVKTLLRRFLLTLSGMVVWAKALAGGSADEQTRSTPETDQKTAGVDSKSPTVNPKKAVLYRAAKCVKSLALLGHGETSAIPSLSGVKRTLSIHR
jgi:hypothetical protein